MNDSPTPDPDELPDDHLEQVAGGRTASEDGKTCTGRDVPTGTENGFNHQSII